jgi:Sulfotransferase domain
MIDFRTRVARAAFEVYRAIFQRAWPTAAADKRILLVVGCQRSGTTLLSEIFARDRTAIVFGEISRLSSLDADRGIRWNPLDDIERQFKNVRARLIVAKPLVETQNLVRILQRFANARAIFLYRDYRDVASSDTKKFRAQHGVGNLRPIVEGDLRNWRSEGVSSSVRESVALNFTESMSPLDAAALFWFARNSLYFDLNLARHDRVWLCKYESLVRQPEAELSRICSWAGLDVDVRRMIRPVHSMSIQKGAGVSLTPDVEKICEGLLARLDAAEACQPQASVS